MKKYTSIICFGIGLYLIFYSATFASTSDGISASNSVSNRDSQINSTLIAQQNRLIDMEGNSSLDDTKVTLILQPEGFRPANQRFGKVSLMAGVLSVFLVLALFYLKFFRHKKSKITIKEIYSMHAILGDKKI